MKKLAVIIVLLTMLFCGNTVFAAVPHGTYIEEATEKNSSEISLDYLDELQERGFKVSRVSSGLKLIKYEGTEKIVNIPDGIFNIGTRAFEGCKNIKKIVFPTNTSLNAIEKYTFKDCTGLEEIIFPNDLKTIEECAFMNCKSLKEINIPTNVYSINDGAFIGCELLSNVKLNHGLETIGNNAFNGCISIKNIEFPETILSIGQGAFSNCISLERVNFNQGLEDSSRYYIYHLAFYNCENLKEVCCVEDKYANQFVFPNGCIVNGKKILWDEERLNLVDEAISVWKKMQDLLKRIGDDNVDLTKYERAIFGSKEDGVAKLLNRYDGYSELPKVVDEREFDELSKGKPVLYRGLGNKNGKTGKECADDFRYKGFYNGVGLYANGTYTSTNVNTAWDYTQQEDNAAILKMVLDDSARVINNTELTYLFLFYKNIDTNYFTKLYESAAMCNGLENLDIGNFAEIAGYDAIYLDGADKINGGDYYVILNRSKVIVSS